MALSAITRSDFFVSYTHVDERWATWIAATLEQGGYTTVLQAWDILPGHDFVHAMHEAARTARFTIAVLSPAYLASRYGEQEWRAAIGADPSGEARRLIPVKIEPCEPSGLLRTRVHIDLTELEEAPARDRLLAGVDQSPRVRSASFPGPGGEQPAPPRGRRAVAQAPRTPDERATREWPEGPDPTLDVLLRSLERQRWSITRGKKHLKVECPPPHSGCVETIVLTPSGPRYARNLRGRLRRSGCWDEEAVRGVDAVLAPP